MSTQPLTIPDHFCAFEASQPGQVFLSEPVNGVYRSFTWAETGRQVRRMAAAMHGMGLKKGDKVAILSKNCAYWIMADLAIAMAGCVSVPLYPNLSTEALCEQLDHSETKLVFFGKLDNADTLRGGLPKGLTYISFPFYPHPHCTGWQELTDREEGIQGKPDIDPQSPATIIYTSGTTGRPKGVMHSFRAMAFAVEVFRAHFPHLKQEVFFSFLPLCHVAERMLVECGSICTGSTLYFVESPDSFAKNLVHARPTVFLAVPRIWEKIQENILLKMPQSTLNRLFAVPGVASVMKYIIRRKLGLDRAKYVFTGASPTSIALLEWYARLGIVIHEAYGMTENLCISHLNRIGSARFGTVGQPHQQLSVRLGPHNEVQVKSDASMLGYYKEPGLTAEAFEDGYLRTGDEGSIDAEGYLTITGRIKDQFKTSKGKYIMPAPIEAHLLTHSLVAQVCVVGSGMPGAMALCNLSASARMLDAETLAGELKSILQDLNTTLEQHEHLLRIVVIPEEWTVANGFLTPTLKIKRKTIDAAFSNHYHEWSRRQEPVIFL